jgi:hypothetical protein
MIETSEALRLRLQFSGSADDPGDMDPNGATLTGAANGPVEDALLQIPFLEESATKLRASRISLEALNGASGVVVRCYQPEQV